MVNVLTSQYFRSFVRAFVAIFCGIFIAAVANGDKTTHDFLVDIASHWVFYIGSVAAPAILAAENQITKGDSKQ